ncbi:unnamed protein product [Didymodactylos carnosus]|uniref:Uncharacterized protein n=1 Tax=Didymodactylos carnosus TaxID=1234261 RepID=A0A8S2FMB0_9BILA|nr:unnamed protein product [Didymodactylos carnosus]CAF4285650.1 unnamed protein product [Didymodactylos carnosus]
MPDLADRRKKSRKITKLGRLEDVEKFEVVPLMIRSWSEVEAAYPLSGIQESSLPPQQPLFAYLPLRSYGFRIIFQADFEISATRQEVIRDNLWNE